MAPFDSASPGKMGDQVSGSASLRGRNVTLRRMAISDTSDVLRWRSDPFVMANLFSDRAPTKEEHESWFRAMDSGNDRREFVIVDNATSVAIGTISLNHIAGAGRSAEYGILIGEREFRGRGLAREASDLIIGYGFDVLHLDEIYLEMFADNTQARRLYETLGFVDDRESAGQIVKNGAVRQKFRMRLWRPAWQARNSS